MTVDTNDDTTLLADFRRYRKTRDPALREHLLLHDEHQKLVRFWANYYHAANWTLEDKMQEGQIGLLRAIDRYDPDGLHQGRAFRTVASFAIRKQIARAMGADIAAQDTIPMSLIIPNGVSNPGWLNSREITRELPALEPSVEEQVMATVDGAQVSNTLEAALLLLSEHQRTIIERRYGLGGDGICWTLAEVGQLLGRDKSNVLRQQRKALAILRQHLLQQDDGIVVLRALNERQRQQRKKTRAA